MPSTTAEQIDFLLAGLGDRSGRVLSGGKVFAFDAGTDTPRDTWIDADQNTLSPNPLILDSRGTVLAFASGDYKFVIKDSDDVVMNTRDFEFYGSQGVGQFFIADDPRPGAPGDPGDGELVTGDGTDGGGGGGNSGAQITDSGSVNSPPILCGSNPICHCGCCNPKSYRITLGGQTGLFEGLNGVWIAKRLSGARVGLYHRQTPDGLIILDLTGSFCNGMKIIAGDLVDTASFPAANVCVTTGSVGALTWEVCPFEGVDALDPIEVTFFGIVACPGCVDRIGSPNKSSNNISISGVNGTFSIAKGGTCGWNFQDVGVQHLSHNFFNQFGCITPQVTTQPDSMDIDVDFVSPNILVTIAAVADSGGGGILFRGTFPLVDSQNNCIDSLSIPNTANCTDGSGNQASGGFASINWVP